MKTIGIAMLMLLRCSGSVQAQETQPLAWDRGQDVIGHVSDGLVAVNLTGDAWTAWRADDRRERWSWACRTGLGYGTNEILKRAVHRTRPDGSDRKSFPSMHTMGAVMSSGWNLQIGGTIAIGAGYGRAAANKHFISDILAGGSLGAFARWVCR